MTPSLRPALHFNALLSLASGAALLLAPATIGGWLGIDGTGWLRLVGVVLVGHAALIMLLLPRLGLRRTATLNLLAIAPYPALMVLAVATGIIDRPVGVFLALLDGLVIAAVAAMLWVGLRSATPARQPAHA